MKTLIYINNSESTVGQEEHKPVHGKNLKSLFIGKRVEGTYTLESAYVVPIILLVLFTVIFYVFYLHDILLADAWAAHLAEEGRMAVTYGRIPFSASIYTEGFEDEDSLTSCNQMLLKNVDKAGRNLLTGELSADEIGVTEKETGVSLKTASGQFVMGSNESKKNTEYVEQARNSSNAGEIARLTTAVYRMAKELAD